VTTLIPIFIFVTVREIPAVILLGFWFVLQFFTGVAALQMAAGEDVGGVAYFAHIGGFVAGMLLVVIMGGLRRRPPPRAVIDSWR
jgi:membrane associated rhomboid family serine protease